MEYVKEFTFEVNKSERAKQVKLLVPALKNPKIREQLFSNIILENHISSNEIIKSSVMHFVWVLRDTFTYERDKIYKNTNEQDRIINAKNFIDRWGKILNLSMNELNINLWKNPKGEYKGIKDFIVNPCQKIGWIEKTIRERIINFKLSFGDQEEYLINELIKNRRIMNTECDCLLQTPNNLIIIECKDNTNFNSEQKKRQSDLIECLQRLFNKKVLYIEVCNEGQHTKNANYITWDYIKKLLKT